MERFEDGTLKKMRCVLGGYWKGYSWPVAAGELLRWGLLGSTRRPGRLPQWKVRVERELDT